MTNAPARPCRDLTREEVAAYQRDGVICARGIIPQTWLDKLKDAIESAVREPNDVISLFSRQQEGFTGGQFLWKQMAPFHDYVCFGPTARIAQQAMASRRVNNFFDQLFVKEPGCGLPTPWHHDLPYWPLKGEQICSVWTPLGSVNKESSGLEFIARSHKWNRFFKPQTISKAIFDPGESGLEDVPDIDGNRGDYDILSWDMEHGDALILHALVLHGSGANTTNDQGRSAFVTRFTGDDVIWDPRPGTLGMMWNPELAEGQAMGGRLFPQILPDFIPGEGADAFTGPDMPAPRVLEAIRARQRAGKAS